jgi:hypothetical protein
MSMHTRAQHTKHVRYTRIHCVAFTIRYSVLCTCRCVGALSRSAYDSTTIGTAERAERKRYTAKRPPITGEIFKILRTTLVPDPAIDRTRVLHNLFFIQSETEIAATSIAVRTSCVGMSSPRSNIFFPAAG